VLQDSTELQYLRGLFHQTIFNLKLSTVHFPSAFSFSHEFYEFLIVFVLIHGKNLQVYGSKISKSDFLAVLAAKFVLRRWRKR